MDESWLLLMGSEIPRRKSTDPSRSVVGDSETLNPVDFSDVFGGPPRSVFFPQHSEDLSASSFYDEIFRSQPESDGTAARRGRNLPVFRIPAAPFRRNGGFYDDIFGSGEDRRSRSRSKSNSSSVLSSEDLSPLRPSGTDDGGFASFASKLRPIIVPNRQSSSSSTASKKQGMSGIPCARTSFTEFQQQWPAFDELFWKPHFRFSQRMPSPETISLDPNSYQTIKSPADEEIDSPLSEISSLGLQGRGGPDAVTEVQEQPMQEEEEEEEAEADDDGEADFLSSFVIEIMPDRREAAEEAVTVDEAIAWAKEKSESPNDDNFKDIFREKESRREPPFTKSDEGKHIVPRFEVQPRRGCENTDLLLARASEELRRWESNEETHQHAKDIATEISEGDIKRWSAGKEGNIRSLLSTLQYILWPTSGWQPIPLMDMIEPSNVKKAYQKARLCLHPDKLQQKSATDPQKHVAEKVFAILQDAWAAFNGQDAFSG